MYMRGFRLLEDTIKPGATFAKFGGTWIQGIKMKIPLAFTDKGYFVKIYDKHYYFVLVECVHSEYYKQYRIGTWEEFKTLYPKTVYPNGEKIKYRMK